MFAACQESLDEKCARETKDYTEKKCPAPIGENLVIDSMTFDCSTHTLHYFYTLNISDDNETTIDYQDIRNLLLKQIRNATSIKEYKDAGYNFAYTYRSAKNRNKILFEATFTYNEYN